MAKIEPMTFEPSEPWVRTRSNHVTISTNRIGREELEQATKRDEDGDTLLHVAVARGNEPACRKLVEIFTSRNMPLDIKNNVMQTPLHLACIIDHPEIAALLLNANPAGCDVTDRHGNNSVHLAIKHSQPSTQYLTLRNVINAASLSTLEKKNLYGLAPVHVAAIEGNHHGIRLLKKAGADINLLENKGGASPIILATRTSQREAAQALLELGANPNLRTTYGESASQLASAKGDHVISELLALYDSPYDVTKHSSLPRYMNGVHASADLGKQDLLSRRHDMKLKPFINSRLANGNAFTSSLPQVTSSVTARTSSPRNEALRVKSERKSPADAFPSNSRRQPDAAVSNGHENSNQPLNFVVRKPTHRAESVSAPVTSQTPKRKLDDNEPLDLSSKKLKPAQKQNHSDANNSLPSQPNESIRSEKYVFVQPFHQPNPVQFQPQLYYKVVPHPLPAANHVPGNASRSVNQPAVELPSSYQPISKRVVDPRSLNYPINSRHAAELHHLAQYSAAKNRDLGPRQTQGVRQNVQRIPANYNKPRHHDRQVGTNFVETRRSIQPARKLSPEKRLKVHPMPTEANRIFNQFQPMAKRTEASHDAHVVRDKSRSIRKPSSESRDKYQPTTRDLNEVGNPPTAGRVEESRDRHRLIRQHSHLEHVHSLPLTFHSTVHPPDDRATVRDSSVNRERQKSLNRERRYQSDDRCRNNTISHPIGKHSIVRRNSAPVSAKMGGDKLDLHSYTGCLPPHFLHLLESSGNLPIKPSNALRNVADVLRDDATTADVTIKQEPPESVKETVLNKTNTISPKASPRKQATSPPKATSTFSSSVDNVSGPDKKESSSGHQVNHFANLGQWESIESGEYPAFGKPQVLTPGDKTKKIPPTHSVAYETFQVDEKYVSDRTKALLKNVAKARTPMKVIPPLQWGLCVGKTHLCQGCSIRKNDVPEIIKEIWNHKPTNKYVTSPSLTSLEVVYCSQLNVQKSPRTTPSPASQTIGDFTTATTPSTNDVKAAPSSPDARSAQTTKSDLSRRTSLDTKLQELRQKAVGRQNDVRSTATSNPREENHNVIDDILANSIEDSSDDEHDDEPIAKRQVTPVNGVTVRKNDVTTSSNGFHNNLPQVIKKTILKNLELQSEVFKKIQNVRAIVSRSNRDDIEKEIGLSDLEISDDEDDGPGRKI